MSRCSITVQLDLVVVFVNSTYDDFQLGIAKSNECSSPITSLPDKYIFIGTIFPDFKVDLPTKSFWFKDTFGLNP